MCNQEIKFKLFFDTAIENGADFIATGHYAQTKSGKLLQAVDENKDQTYFLYRISSEALKKTIFPLGKYKKTEVRKMAQDRKLLTAHKKESMGICFVGKVGIKEFLQQYVKTEPGPIVDENGLKLGYHDGAIFYTIGQRHGLNVGGGLPYYVTGKDIQLNTVFVTKNIHHESLWHSEISVTQVHWIADEPKNNDEVLVRTRHRAPLQPTQLIRTNSHTSLMLKDKLRALTPGQSAVVYRDGVCLGGGIIN